MTLTQSVMGRNREQSLNTLRAPAALKLFATMILVAGVLYPCDSIASPDGYTMPGLPSEPVLPPPNPPNTVAMGDPANFAEVAMDFPIQTGSFQPSWASIAANYPTATPSWFRAAKFGMWVHYGPQASGASGDWFAQHMYQQGSTAYNNHLAAFGHPSTSGYKDVVRAWNPVDYSPTALAQLYYSAGARMLLIQGVHHDQFDNWNSTYNPWNEMNFGPKRDTMAEWVAAARSLGMRYGISFHHEYGWWFLQPAYTADTTGTLAGVGYDAEQLLGTTGSGTWWQNLDISRLYLTNLREYQGINTPTSGYWDPTQGIFINHLGYAHWYATQWGLRIIDAIEQYDPDFIYTDGDSTQPFSGYGSGTGYKCNAAERVVAHFYNEAAVRHGMVDKMSFIKFHPPLNGLATTSESGLPSGIKTDQPWVSEMSVGDWFWEPGISYDNGTSVVHWILETASRDGAALVNVCPNGAGDLDNGAVTMLHGVGQWMAVNGQGIYGSRAWNVFSEGTGSSTTSDFRFTVGADGYLYAYCMTVPAAGTQLNLNLLASNSSLLVGPIGTVTMLGNSGALTWSQTAGGLSVTCPTTMPTVPSGTGVGFRIGPPSAIGGVPPTSIATQPQALGIDLSWNYPSFAPAAVFNVKRGLSPSGPFSAIASNVTGTNYTDATGSPGTLYYYTVSAVVNGLESPNVAAASAERIAAGGLGNWSTLDVGSTSVAGSLGIASGTYTMSGAGTDVWYNADGFRYAFQQVSGDCTVTARVLSMTNTAPWAKAGVMIRQSLDPASAQVDAFMSPSNGFACQERSVSGGASSVVTNNAGTSAPYWVRLIRTGNTFSAYYSPDGNTWTLSGTTTVAMNAVVCVGLVTCSVNSSTPCLAVFDHVTVSSGISVPSWQSEDIGAVNVAGAFFQNSGTSTLIGAGTDVWYNADSFRYAFQALSGDCVVTARVLSMTNTAGWAKAGVMIRGSLDANAPQVDAFMSPSNGFAFQRRTAWSGTSGALANAQGLTAPYWVRIGRIGNSFTAYYSSNGTTWTTVGTTSVPMGQTVYAGLIACSVNSSTLCTAVFDNVSVGATAYLKCDEGSGTSAYDATGNGWTGTLQGGATWGQGEINGGVILSGSSQYISLPSGIASGQRDMTVAAWVNLSGSATAAHIFDFGTSATNCAYLTGQDNQTNSLTFHLITGGTNAAIAGSLPLSSGTWCHVAVSEANGVGTLYLNGTAVGINANMSLSPASLGLTTSNYIGRSQSSADPCLNGTVDQFRVFGRALSPVEIGALVLTPPPAPGGVTATPGAGQITVGWSGIAGAIAYDVKRSLVSGGPYSPIGISVTGTSFLDANVNDGVPYYYVISSVNTPVEGGESQQVSAVPFGSPAGPPDGVTTTNGNGSVIINWDATPGATGYLIERASTNGGAYAVIGTSVSGSFTDTNLTNGVSYYYVVSATNSAGASSNYSTQVTALPSLPISPAEQTAPAIKNIGLSEPASIELDTHGSVSGHVYQVQYSYNLTQWYTSDIAPQAGDGNDLKFALGAGMGANVFYRILVQRP